MSILKSDGCPSREAASEHSPARKRWVCVCMYIPAPQGRQNLKLCRRFAACLVPEIDPRAGALGYRSYAASRRRATVRFQNFPVRGVAKISVKKSVESLFEFEKEWQT